MEVVLYLFRNARQIQGAESQNQTYLLVVFFFCDQHLLPTSSLQLSLEGVLVTGLKKSYFIHTDLLVLVFSGCCEN